MSVIINGDTGITTPAETIATNLTFTGTGNRITGDFTNATVDSRALFQTSTVNGGTRLSVIPNGTSFEAAIDLYLSSSDTSNSSRLSLRTNSTEMGLVSSRDGTGTYLPLIFSTGGSERVRIDTSGNVGIGASSPAQKLQVNGNILLGTPTRNQATSDFIGINTSDDPADNTRCAVGFATTAGASSSDSYIYFNTNKYGVSGGERMRIDSTGNVGIGTASPGAKLDITNNQAALSYLIDTNNTTNGGGSIWRMITRNIANTGTTSVEFYKPTGTGFSILNNDTNASNFTAFNVGASERMRIDSSGNLLVGTTSNNKAPLTVQTAPLSAAYGQIAAFSAAASDVGNAGISVTKYDNVTTTSQVFARFLVNQGATASGQINANGASAAAFGSYSDSRLKENIVDLPSQLANIMALRPVEYDYIASEGGGHQIGFVAQEVQEIYPDLVGERNDGMLTLSDMNKNDARLIKCIQEQQALITQLQADVATLKALSA